MNGVGLRERVARTFLVKQNELDLVVYNLGLFLLLGVGLAIGRGTADALLFKRYGIEYLPVVYVLSALALAASCTLYASFADRLSSERFFKYILATLAAALIVVRLLMMVPSADWVYPLYYVVYEVASELVLIHAGLYLNQNFDALQAKRLVPLVFGGSQIGVILGGIMLAVMSPLIGVGNIVLIWMLVSVIAIVLMSYWHRHRGISPFFRAGHKRKRTAGETLGEALQGVRFMKHSALLRMASFSLFFMVIMFYVLIYSVNQIYTEAFDSEEKLSSFFGVLVAVNSAIALLLQFFVANRLLRRYGVKTVNMFFPFTSVLSYVMLLFSFTLPSALFGSFNKDVVMTAFRNPVWSLMINALPGNIQGRARAMTVAVVIPSALLLAGLLLMLVREMDSPVYVAVLGLVTAVLYLYFSHNMNRVYVAEIINHLKQKLSLPDDESLNALRGNNEQVLEDLVKGIDHEDDQIFLAYSSSLIRTFPDQATEIIAQRLPRASSKVRDQVIRLMLPLASEQLPPLLWQMMESADERLQSTCYYSLIKLGDEKVKERIPGMLESPQARFRSVAIYGVYRFDMQVLLDRARQAWGDLIVSDDSLDNMFGMELLASDTCMGHEARLKVDDVQWKPVVERLMLCEDVRSCLAFLRVSRHFIDCDTQWFQGRLAPLVQHENRKVRLACLESCINLDPDNAKKGIEPALDDPHPQVRELAAQLFNRLPVFTENDKSKFLTSSSGSSPRAQSAVLHLVQMENATVETMASVVDAKLTEIEQLGEASFFIKQRMQQFNAPALGVLSLLLEERVRAMVDLTLQALRGSEDADAIDVICTGMKSQDIQLRASACEALQGLHNKAVGRSLSRVIEASDQHKTNFFPGLEQVLEWCINRRDPWLKECAQAARVSMTSVN